MAKIFHFGVRGAKTLNECGRTSWRITNIKNIYYTKERTVYDEVS